MISLAEMIKTHARSLGFELVGIAAAVDAETFPYFETWLEADYAGEMDYLHRHGKARQHPSSIVSNVRSVVMVGMNYGRAVSDQPSAVGSQQSAVSGRWSEILPDNSVLPSPVEGQTAGSKSNSGRVASYALGRDYHEVLRSRLKELLAWICTQAPECRGRVVVDTAPLLERDFARRAGLGWFGKNTMLINKKAGSYFFLGALLLDIELPEDRPHETSHCGTCTACLDACPTAAFPRAGQLDARKCISYLTIELRGQIAEELRPAMGEWIFGCDVCQDVCPWNHKAPPSRVPEFAPRADVANIDLIGLLYLSEEEFRARFRDSPLSRPRRGGLLRNAAIALGNSGDASALAALEHAARDANPLVREAANWAITRLKARLETKTALGVITPRAIPPLSQQSEVMKTSGDSGP